MSERTERVVGFTLLGVPVFDAAIFALDNYTRLELLVKLHEVLPAFLLNPVFIFVCLCLGIVLLDRSYKQQIKRLSSESSGLVGVEAYRQNKTQGLIRPFLLVCLLVLLLTPALAIIYSLAYKGTPPMEAHIPSHPNRSARLLIVSHQNQGPELALSHRQ